MKNYSTTQAGNLAVLAGALVILARQAFGVELEEGNVTIVLAAVGIILGAAASWYGRYKKGDLTIGGFRNVVER